MRASKTLAKLRAGQPARTCCLGHFIPSFVCHAAHYGFDCIWLDLEHRAMEYRDVQALLASCHRYDIDCLLRPPTTEKTRLYRYLEDGATGLMIPHVSTVEKARELVEAVKFPPVGNRGLDGAGLDGDYYVGDRDAYAGHADRETFLVVQIETPEAVENVEPIAEVEGVDGMFLGTGDLGLRLRRSNTTLTIEQATQRVAEACKSHGKFWGRPAGSIEEVREHRSLGAGLLVWGNDFVALMQSLENASRDLDQVDAK